MQVVRQFTRQRHTLLLMLAVLALLMRAALPAGWMPSMSAGSAAISVCSGEGRTTMWLDKSGQVHKSDPNEEDRGDTPCAFASIAGTVAAPLGEAPTAALPEQLLAFGSLSDTFPGRGLSAPPPPQTGPPLLI